MRIAIDPGPLKSGVVMYEMVSELPKVIGAREVENPSVLTILSGAHYDALAIEMIASYGMAVGKSVFDTCVWIGRFYQMASIAPNYVVPDLVFRTEVKLRICGQSRAKDANVLAAVKDLYGGKDCRGTKKNPGPLYGVSGHCMSALAVAIARENAGNFKR